MKIEVAVENNDSPKDRGDLLEGLIGKLLKIQSYDVISEIRLTGVELDLLAEHKYNKKQVYVECKAYRGQTISAEVVTKLFGIRGIKKYQEAWLVVTSEFGKDAKGLIKEISEGDDAKYFSFISPSDLIDMLSSAHMVRNADEIRVSLESQEIKNLDDFFLIITKFGYYWCATIKVSGITKSCRIFDAVSGSEVDDGGLIANIVKTDTSISKLNILNDKFKKEISFSPNYLASIKNTFFSYFYQKDSLDISDMFVFPDLRDDDKGKIINSSKIFKENDTYSRVLIFGDSTSGKTSLAVNLQQNFFNNGLLPVYILGSDIKEYTDIKTLVKKNLEVQYQHFEDFLESKEICLIIDDFHLVKSKKDKILDKLNNYSNKIIIFSNFSIKIELTTVSVFQEKIEDYAVFKLLELGHEKRDELIEKYLKISKAEPADNTSADLYHKIVDVAQKINSVVGKDFIPTYPFFILTLLQSIEVTSTRSLQGSAYAEFYNFLITKALDGCGVKASQLDMYYSCLSDIAYFLFKQESSKISCNELDLIIKQFMSKKYLDYKSGKLIKDFLSARILVKYGEDDYTFTYKYIYYFFIAKYLSDSIEEKDTQAEIVTIIENLGYDDFADIILFIIHHSRKNFIIDKVIDQAKNLFCDLQPASFSLDEVNDINKLVDEEIKLIIDQHIEHENLRRDALREQDELENEQAIKRIDNSNESYGKEFFSKIALAFKLIDILGQIAKNHYGSLNGDYKVNIVSEAYNLGLRLCTDIMQGFIKQFDVLEKGICEAIENNGMIDENKKKKIARDILFKLATLISYSFVERISRSVASKELFFVFDNIVSNDDSVSKQLINTSIKLGFPSGVSIKTLRSLNESYNNNYLANTILRVMAVSYLYKFKVDYQKKQEICSTLMIDLNGVLANNNQLKEIK